MKPLPAEGSLIRKPIGTTVLPTALPQTGGPRSNSNRKIPAPASQRAYPLLLLASTAVAGVFCYLYLTKPVIVAAPVSAPAAMAANSLAIRDNGGGPESSIPTMMVPDRSGANPTPRSPAVDPRSAALAKPGDAPYEETNFQVQNVIMATTPDGIVNRLSVKVPVIYRSRNLRWTTQEVATARDLLTRMTAYQEKTRALHDEGTALSNAWNQLISRSIPPVGLQADSPTLPVNQTGAAPAASDTIHLQPSGK